MIVRLTRAEVLQAATAGLHRQLDSLFEGRDETVPGIGEGAAGWGRHIEAACAELAFAKAIGRYWDGSLWRFRGDANGDVGLYQVRSTTHLDGHLILRAHDRDQDRFVLVVGVAPELRIVGAITGRDGKSDAFVRDPGGRGRPCWYVPQSELEAPRTTSSR